MAGPTTHGPPGLRQIPLSYNNADSEGSALRLVYSLFPEWETEPGEVQFTRFTDGITNTLLKAAKVRPGWSPAQVDADAILLRAYGNFTEVLIDREKETTNHQLLAERNLAPALLARFTNGLLYRFIPGRVCSAHDLQQAPVWRAVARRLGEWHARLPVLAEATKGGAVELALPRYKSQHTVDEINGIAPGKLTPNPWTVMQKWIFALPGDAPDHAPAERERKAWLQAQLHRVVAELADLPGIGREGLVLAHCDLLCGNVIVEPRAPAAAPSATTNGTSTHPDASSSEAPSSEAPPSSAPPPSAPPSTAPSATAPPSAPSSTAALSSAPAQAPPVEVETETVSFIDYEYATPAPAAFDLANHFAEWGGLDCDPAAMPTKSVRREFLREYLGSYRAHLAAGGSAEGVNGADVNGSGRKAACGHGTDGVHGTHANGHVANGTPTTNGFHPSPSAPSPSVDISESDLDALFHAVDRFRGLPGLYWGIWALIQALISQIDFDYDAYAKQRLSEYEVFRRTEANGGRPVEGDIREVRWAEE